MPSCIRGCSRLTEGAVTMAAMGLAADILAAVTLEAVDTVEVA
jgi:hypothetical protein